MYLNGPEKAALFWFVFLQQRLTHTLPWRAGLSRMLCRRFRSYPEAPPCTGLQTRTDRSTETRGTPPACPRRSPGTPCRSAEVEEETSSDAGLVRHIMAGGGGGSGEGGGLGAEGRQGVTHRHTLERLLALRLYALERCTFLRRELREERTQSARR